MQRVRRRCALLPTVRRIAAFSVCAYAAGLFLLATRHIDSESRAAVHHVTGNSPLSLSSYTDGLATSSDRKRHELLLQFKYQEDLEYCSAVGKNNLVLERPGSGNGQGHNRIFSISPNTFRSHHAKECATLKATLAAIRNGKRHWADEESLAAAAAAADSGSVAMEQVNWLETPSYFVPDGCDVPALTSHEMCNVLSRWSDIAIDGDSIGRHVRQGLLMGLREDLVLGAILTDEQTAAKAATNPYSRCRCDGQFSEADVCRQNNGLFHNFTASALSVCSHLTDAQQFAVPALYSGLQDQTFPCDHAAYRGLLLILQAGPWYRRRANWKSETVSWFQEHFAHPQFQKCLAHNKVHVLWLGYGTTQTVELNTRYPHQSRKSIEEFNNFTADYLSTLPFPVTVMDWVNLTYGSQSSDGVHGLAEVNLVKAFQIVNVANMLKPQQ